ncbi:EamA-like transporter family [Seminavis robusta]|uniref:EamA-like transporter family n=1 Tax=Seminavis robusta TaxID=568900 RepID=A0A9N8DXA7_9STRA|nr:EamA-like transporter family [Seminavis robusta]|eukprot:Sro342_g121850.1 EamA-like transporter family (400) ;mRNA; r:72079-73278
MTATQSIHAALILANAIFGLGSIVGALGISQDTNPLSFTFVREICSGGILWALSALCSNSNQKTLPELSQLRSFWKLGFLLFLNQAGYIVGILLAGPVTGSIWQPSAPIITVAISMIGGLEPWNARRVMGVMVAFGGCAAMVILSDRASDDTHGGTLNFWLGNALFLMNCTATAFYILSSKPVLLNYPALTVTAWSYLLASVFMLIAALSSASVPSIDTLICPACSLQEGTFPTITIPRATFPALTYYILFQSVASWGLILWANQYATGTLVVGYSVTQPISSIFFTTLFLFTHLVQSCQSNEEGPCLSEPGFGTFCGMAGVACGLALVVRTEPTAKLEDGTKPTTKVEDDDTIETPLTASVDYGSLNLFMETKKRPNLLVDDELSGLLVVSKNQGDDL